MSRNYQNEYGYDQPEVRKNKGMTMQGLAVMAVGCLTLIVVFTIVPLVANELEIGTATLAPPASGAGSQWNYTVNPDIPTAWGLWQTLGGMVKVGGVIVVVMGFITAVRGLRG